LRQNASRSTPATLLAQAKSYAQQLGVPFVFLSNGFEVRFWEWEREAFARQVKTIFRQDDLIRRAASRQVRRDLMSVPVDRRIVERDYQLECIDTLCREIDQGRRKLLIEMATGSAAVLTRRLLSSSLRAMVSSNATWRSKSKSTKERTKRRSRS